MTAPLCLLVAMTFSSLPSPFYRSIALDHPYGSWTTAVLFAVHGAASVVTMSALATRAGAAAAGRLGTGHLVAVALLVDVVGGILLAVADGPDELALLVGGRLVTGLALGIVVPVLSSAVTAGPRSSQITTGVVLGGVGAGALCGAGLAALGLDRGTVFVLGTGAVALAAAFAFRLPETVHAARRPSEGALPAAVVVGAAALAFASNGILGLFSSTLPGIVADLGPADAGTAISGVTAGMVLLAAGAARLLTSAAPVPVVRWGGACAAAAGLALFATGLALGAWPAAFAGGLALGVAAGVGYDAALDLATRLSPPVGRLRALAAVQRGGQLGLVLPALASPLALAR